VLGLTATALAMLLQLQWVPPGGVLWRVCSTIFRIVVAGIVGFRPRPGATLRSPEGGIEGSEEAAGRAGRPSTTNR